MPFGGVRGVYLCTRGGLHLHVVISSGWGEICGRWLGACARRVAKQSTCSVRERGGCRGRVVTVAPVSVSNLDSYSGGPIATSQ